MNIPEGYVLVPVDPIKAIDMGWAYLDAAREAEPNKRHSFSHAGYRAMVAAAPPVEISAFDEAKERELFELNHEVPDGVYFSKEKNEYRSMNMRGFEILACEELTPKFKGWIACAKSRARSAE